MDRFSAPDDLWRYDPIQSSSARRITDLAAAAPTGELDGVKIIAPTEEEV